MARPLTHSDEPLVRVTTRVDPKHLEKLNNDETLGANTAERIRTLVERHCTKPAP